MWIGVTARFSAFHAALHLTDDQYSDGETKHRGVRKCLNRNYYGSQSETDNSFLVGSWAKLTKVRPPRDVDLYFVLPYSVYLRFSGNAGNIQSSLLQEVRGVLQGTYSTSDIKGDGPVVLVRFNTINVEVVPVFLLDNGRYFVPHTSNGGSYKVSDPVAEEQRISAVDVAYSNNLRPIVQMLKAWQWYCNVPIKSFHLELIAAAFLEQSPWRNYGYFYYDYFIRDFFAYLLAHANGTLYAPGTNEPMLLGDDWRSRAETAQARALRACQFEYVDQVASAGEEWQKIFGNQIPMHV
jgi:hypothetical protein